MLSIPRSNKNIEVVIAEICIWNQHFAYSLSNFNNLHIHFGIFRQRNDNLLAHKARSLSNFSNSRIDFGIFRQRNGCLLAAEPHSLSDFSNSPIDFGVFRKLNGNLYDVLKITHAR